MHGDRPSPRLHPQQPLSLQIDRVVVDGFPMTPAQTAQMHTALEIELHRLMNGDGRHSPWQSAATASLQAPHVRAAATTAPAQLGREIARSVFAALGRTP
jgi:hypothetical protein